MKKNALLILIVLFASCKSKMQPDTKTSKEIGEKQTEIVKEDVKKENLEKPEAKERFEKVDLKEVTVLKQNRAFDLGKRLLETCNTSKFKVFTKEEATDKVIQNATVEKISKTCQKILVRNGKFVDLELLDITLDNDSDSYIFRYNIVFEKKYFKRELFVTVNDEDKVSEMKTKEVYQKPM